MTAGLGGVDGDEPGLPAQERFGKRELQDRAVRGVTWTMVHTLVSLPIAFVVNLVVARVLGVVDYGRLALLSVVMDAITGAVMLGVNPALVQFASKAHAVGRRADVARLLSQVQGFRLLVTAPILTVVVVVLISDVNAWIKVLAVAFGVLLPAALDGAPACLVIENKTAAGAKVALASAMLTQVAILGTVLLVAHPDVVWAVRLVMTSVTVLLAFVPISAAYRRAVLRPRLPRGLPAGFWRFALPSGASSLLSVLIVSRTEVVALTWLSDPVSVGLFALAFGLATHMYAPAQAVIGPLIPAISGLREVDLKAMPAAFGRALRGSSAIGAVITGVALPVLAVLVTPLYGASYAGVEPVLIALGVANGFLLVGGPVWVFVMARLSASRILVASVVALGVDIVLALALIPVFGVWGAVVANIGAALTQVLMLMAAELSVLEVSWMTVLRDTSPAFIGAVAAVAGWWASRAVPMTGWAALVAALAGGSVLVVLLRVTRSGLTAADVQSIVRVLPQSIHNLARFVLRTLSWRTSTAN